MLTWQTICIVDMLNIKKLNKMLTCLNFMAISALKWQKKQRHLSKNYFLLFTNFFPFLYFFF